MRNGTVRIRSRYRATSGLSGGCTAHVHRYASSILMNEITNARNDGSFYTVAVLTDGPEASIIFKYVTGKNKGREVIFAPSGDDTGWEEMVRFVNAILTIWDAGYGVH